MAHHISDEDWIKIIFESENTFDDFQQLYSETQGPPVLKQDTSQRPVAGTQWQVTSQGPATGTPMPVTSQRPVTKSLVTSQRSETASQVTSQGAVTVTPMPVMSQRPVTKSQVSSQGPVTLKSLLETESMSLKTKATSALQEIPQNKKQKLEDRMTKKDDHVECLRAKIQEKERELLALQQELLNHLKQRKRGDLLFAFI